MLSRPRSSALVVTGVAAAYALAACVGLKSGSQSDTSATDPDAGQAGGGGAGHSGNDSGEGRDPGDESDAGNSRERDADASGPAPDYTSMQLDLDARAVPLDTTITGSKLMCGENTVFWLDRTVGAIHSRRPDAPARIDYAFKGAFGGQTISVSDRYVVVNDSASALGVYDARTSNQRDAQIPGLGRTFFVALPGSVFLADTTAPGKLGFALWSAPGASLTTPLLPVPEGASGTLSSQATSEGVAYEDYDTKTLRTIDVAHGTSRTFALTGSLSMNAAVLRGAALVLSYVRPDGFALRLFAADGSTFEIGDFLGLSAPMYRGGPADEHRVLGPSLAIDGDTVLYPTRTGIFAYDVATGAIRAVHLRPLAKLGRTDFCFLSGPRIVVYRDAEDTTQTIYATKL